LLHLIPAWAAILQPRKIYSGLAGYIPAQLAVNLLFNIPAYIK
jgi:hypothetical protein